MRFFGYFVFIFTSHAWAVGPCFKFTIDLFHPPMSAHHSQTVEVIRENKKAAQFDPGGLRVVPDKLPPNFWTKIKISRSLNALRFLHGEDYFSSIENLQNDKSLKSLLFLRDRLGLNIYPEEVVKACTELLGSWQTCLESVHALRSITVPEIRKVLAKLNEKGIPISLVSLTRENKKIVEDVLKNDFGYEINASSFYQRIQNNYVGGLKQLLIDEGHSLLEQKITFSWNDLDPEKIYQILQAFNEIYDGKITETVLKEYADDPQWQAIIKEITGEDETSESLAKWLRYGRSMGIREALEKSGIHYHYSSLGEEKLKDLMKDLAQLNGGFLREGSLRDNKDNPLWISVVKEHTGFENPDLIDLQNYLVWRVGLREYYQELGILFDWGLVPQEKVIAILKDLFILNERHLVFYDLTKKHATNLLWIETIRKHIGLEVPPSTLAFWLSAHYPGSLRGALIDAGLILDWKTVDHDQKILILQKLAVLNGGDLHLTDFVENADNPAWAKVVEEITGVYQSAYGLKTLIRNNGESFTRLLEEAGIRYRRYILGQSLPQQLEVDAREGKYVTYIGAPEKTPLENILPEEIKIELQKLLFDLYPEDSQALSHVVFYLMDEGVFDAEKVLMQLNQKWGDGHFELSDIYRFLDQLKHPQIKELLLDEY